MHDRKHGDSAELHSEYLQKQTQLTCVRDECTAYYVIEFSSIYMIGKRESGRETGRIPGVPERTRRPICRRVFCANSEPHPHAKRAEALEAKRRTREA